MSKQTVGTYLPLKNVFAISHPLRAPRFQGARSPLLGQHFVNDNTRAPLLDHIRRRCPTLRARLGASQRPSRGGLHHTYNQRLPTSQARDKRTDKGVTRANRVHNGLPVLELSRMHVENATCVRALSAVHGLSLIHI